MGFLELAFWQRHQRALGFIAIIIGAGAWGMEFAGTVYICPYCRVQRTVILLLGVIKSCPFANTGYRDISLQSWALWAPS